uniref:glucosaminidase domain-containing protein n=1 Tax=Burkholderia anthina TaxID=179879 RepID=UPI001589628D
EVVGGKSIEIVASFRAYSDWQGSIDDHAAFLVSNPRYRGAFSSTSGVEFAEAIAKAGYATDPQYADKLKSIITSRKLDAFDAAPVAA